MAESEFEEHFKYTYSYTNIDIVILNLHTYTRSTVMFRLVKFVVICMYVYVVGTSRHRCNYICNFQIFDQMENLVRSQL